ncbi:D-alanyl-D-alanine carboxypeptidase family protein [Salirhabdus salicampi]|uniref:D-alanyl-D-alanine carboxypeptidase family protein n=1 Tax=Salirhabdus salicampi TaxID=476102 RepID=UPI0020C39BC3|nr:serine hydrolase [Salirhabdus salicampi]MCP8617193.1 D-alanyl-D-alanine carboxypeptidase [Salirhabdus salicampi]
MINNIKPIFIACLTLFVTVVSFIPKPIEVEAAINVEAESAILIDAETGKILFEKQADNALPPASMTKMMTEYLVLEAISEGEISWDTTTYISDYAYRISADPMFSGIGLRQNKEYTVRQLYSAMAIFSDNATTIALAELIAGSEGEFVRMMNEKGEELGLPDFQFVNSTGIPNSLLGNDYPEGTSPTADNLLSAKSTALLAFHLVNNYSDALNYSSMKQYELDGITKTNLNWMLPGMEGDYYSSFGYEGVDGLKTGWTDLAGYCFTGTAERDGRRLISVVMRTSSEAERFRETRKLLDYGFSDFEVKELYPAGYQIKDQSALPVVKGKQSEVSVSTTTPIKTLVKKGEEDAYEAVYEFDEELLTEKGELTAPVEKGDKVGTMKVTYTGEESLGYINDQYENAATVTDIVVNDSVEKANWFSLTLRAVGGFFADLFSNIVNGIKNIF